jgi:hypothetical protein
MEVVGKFPPKTVDYMGFFAWPWRQAGFLSVMWGSGLRREWQVGQLA